MNAMFACEMAKRHPNIGVYALCPGWCHTELARNVNIGWFKKLLIMVVGGMFMRTAYQGAQNILFCLLADQDRLESGATYRDGQLLECDKLKDADDQSKKLWELSEKLTQVKESQPDP